MMARHTCGGQRIAYGSQFSSFYHVGETQLLWLSSRNHCPGSHLSVLESRSLRNQKEREGQNKGGREGTREGGREGTTTS